MQKRENENARLKAELVNISSEKRNLERDNAKLRDKIQRLQKELDEIKDFLRRVRSDAEGKLNAEKESFGREKERKYRRKY